MAGEPTREPGGLYQRMSYLDVAEPDGPAWTYFQLMRARDGAHDDPDRVPDWALRDMARRRIAEGRVACEFLVPPGKRGPVFAELHAALRLVEAFLDGPRPDIEQDVQEHIAAALFGAREIEERRERIVAGLPVDTHDAEPAPKPGEVRMVVGPQPGTEPMSPTDAGETR